MTTTPLTLRKFVIAMATASAWGVLASCATAPYEDSSTRVVPATRQESIRTPSRDPGPDASTRYVTSLNLPTFTESQGSEMLSALEARLGTLQSIPVSQGR